MFICQACRAQVPAHIAPHFKITQTRPKIYPERFKRLASKGPGGKEKRIKIDNGGQGREIVRQIQVCPDCAAGG